MVPALCQHDARMQALLRSGAFAVAALLVAPTLDARPNRRGVPSPHLKGQLVGETRPLNPPFTMNHIPDLWDSSIYAIVQDGLGFIWLGSHTGLGRYDGSEFDVFRADADDPNGLSNGFVTDLVVSPTGDLWVGTGEGGLNKYDATTSRFAHFRHRDDDPTTLASDGISALAFDGDGLLWVAMSDGHVDRLDPATGRATHILTPDALGSPAVDLAFDAQGRLYLATFADGLAVYDPKQRTIELHTTDPALPGSLASNALSRLLVQGEDTLWIATRDRGLDRMDLKTNRFVHYRADAPEPRRITHDNVLDLLLDDDGVVWAGTEVGFNRIDGDQVLRVVRRVDDPELVTFPRWVGVIFQDRAGTYWFGGPATGISTLTQQQLQFKAFRPDASQYQHFAEDRQGRLWTGSYEHGLYRVDRRGGTLTRYKSVRTDDESVALTRAIAAVHGDARGFIWADVEGTGLVRIDPSNGRAVVYPKVEPPLGPGAARIDWITSEPDGTLWLATWGGGLVKMDAKSATFTAWTNDPYDDNPLPATHLYMAVLDPSSPHTLWLATERAGLIRADTDAKTYVQYLHDAADPTSIGHDSVASLHLEPGGPLWVGTYGAGLDRFDMSAGVFEHIQEAEGLEAINIYGIVPEDEGTLWLSTERGLAVVDTRAKRVERTFTRADGLLSNEFFYNGAYRAGTGELFFTNSEGVNYFDPKELRFDPVAYPVAVTGLQLFDQPMDLPTAPWRTSALELGYTESVISIEFAALGRPPGQAARYRYKIDGLQEKWIETTRDFVTLSNLGGGNFVLRLQAADSAGTFPEAGEVQLAIHQDPPPWKTWWAYSIYAALVLGALAVYTRIQSWRLEQLRRQNRLEAVERDLELTGAVQTGFLPRTPLYEGASLRLRGFYRPADVCSGDWWYHASTGRGAYNVLVGDVTGHGPGPAMVTAAAATAFRVHEEKNNDDVKTMLRAINQQVLAVSGGQYQMTMTVVQLDEATGTFRSYSAGGLPAIRISRGGGRAKLYPCRGTPLGSEDFEVGMIEGNLEPGDRLFLFTDGLPELNLPNDKMLGMRGFTRILEKSREQDLIGAVEQIISEADALRGEQTQDDDWTFAILEWNGGAATVN